MAIEGLEGSRELLKLHLTDLYMLDTEQFRKACAKIGDCTFDAVGAGVLKVLTGAISVLK